MSALHIYVSPNTQQTEYAEHTETVDGVQVCCKVSELIFPNDWLKI